ncbi:helix-turn-helix domain-containing protein [Saccharopolyspora sp. CA-218241]|uniref:helix-turn-helix domain-containing protein n=1 Tax=Saccharopolyspora sp. CA-218241 TaxID=3240027 RepID=UPI003D96C3A7
MLRQLRHQSGKTLRDAAEWLNVGDPGVSKMELGKSAIKVQTVRALGQLYDVDAARLDYLLRLAGEANQRGWWTAYRDTVPDWFRQFVGLEADALDLWNYEAEYVPGLLQTPDYVRALLRATRPDMTDDDIESSVQLRRERQERIDGDHPPRLHFYINEAVIRRPVGTPAVVGGQLEKLIESSKLDHVALRILPFSAGPHPAMFGSFVMMQFPDEGAPAFVYVEHERGAIYQEDPGDVDRFTVIVDTLDQLSLSPEDSRGMMVEASNAQ